MVTEYMTLGSLSEFLPTCIRNNLVLINMAIDVANGMIYLSDQGIVHRDLAGK